MERKFRLLRSVTGVAVVLGLLVVLNQLRIPFYLYYPHVTQTGFFSDHYDLYFFVALSLCVPCTLAVLTRKLSKPELVGAVAIWGMSFAAVILGVEYAALVLYASVIYAAILDVSNADLRRRAVSELMTCVFAFLVLFELSSLFYWVSASLNPHQQLGLVSQELELNLTYSIFPLGIPFMVILLLSWIPLIYLVWRPRRGAQVLRYEPPKKWNLRLFAAALDFFAVVAVIVFFYPYLAGQTWIVGVDSYWRYLNPLTSLAGLAPSEVFFVSFRHGFYVAFLYLIELAMGGSAFSIVKFAPLILTFAMASAVFMAIVRGGWGFKLAVLSGLCTLLWFPTTLGIYAGLQSNWLAYFLWMVFLSSYFQMKSWNVMTFLLQGLVSLAILIVHPWTWGVFVASLLVTALVSQRTAWKTRSVQGALAPLIIALPVSAGAYQMFPSLGSDWLNAMGLYVTPLIQPTSLLTFGSAMLELFLNWSPFLSPILLVLCLAGVYGLSEREGGIKNYIVGWIIVWCLGSIIFAPSGFTQTNIGISETGLWRVLYISPLPILLALGMQKCLRITSRLDELTTNSYVSLLPRVSLLSVVLVASGSLLFFSEDIVVRLMGIAGVVVVLVFLAVRYPNWSPTRFLIISFLILVLVNSAFRSLYPLLLDPHSLFGPIAGQ